MRVKITLHLLGTPEAQARGVDLFREQLGFEGLFPGHDQQVEICLLPVGQEEVFADLRPQQAFHQFTFLYGVCVLMVHPEIFDSETVQEIVAALLPGRARLLRPAGEKSFGDVHEAPPRRSFFRSVIYSLFGHNCQAGEISAPVPLQCCRKDFDLTLNEH